jgi:SAM-dependent methyltransferase
MTARYTFPNAWELARRRLELLEACHDPGSFRRAAALGVGPGSRCLDAGAGAGSFARWLVDRTGDVLAVDIDVRLVEEIDAPGLEVRRHDLAHDELPRGEFDFVHTRLVLIHVPERDAVLRRLADALRPGGVLLVEEDDIDPLATTKGAYREAWDAVLELTGAAGLDGEWGAAAVSRYGTRSTACIACRLHAAASVSPCSWRAGFMPAASASRL